MEERIFGGASPSRRLARPVWNAMKRGAASRCPSCGKGKLFSSFLKTVPACESCGEEIHHHRADDLPAYLVVVIAGHIVVGAFMSVETVGSLSTWQHLAIWIPLTIALSLALIRPLKGAVIGLQWALYMHGFDSSQSESEPKKIENR